MKLGEHIHHQFDKELDSLRSRVLAMGGLVERQVSDALTALMERNSELAEYVVRTDHRVNAQEVGIDEDCTYVLARRQPAAGDLRTVMAIIKTITDIERIGDESEKIAHMVTGVSEHNIPGLDGLLENINEMGNLVRRQLRESLDAFARMDVDAAVSAAAQDATVDRHYVSLLSELIENIKGDPEDTEQFQRLIWVVRSLERIGDHSKNICEYVVYLVRGKDVRHTSIDAIEQEIGD